MRAGVFMDVQSILRQLVTSREVTPSHVVNQVKSEPGYPPPVTGFKVARVWEDRGQTIFLLTWRVDPNVRPWVSHYRITAVDMEPPVRVMADVERHGSPAVIPLDLARRTNLRFVLQIVLRSGASSPIDQSPCTSAVAPEPRWRAVTGDASSLQYPVGFALEVSGNQIGYLAHRSDGGSEVVLRDGTNSGGIDGQGAKVFADGSTGNLTAYSLRIMQTPSATAGTLAGYLNVSAGATTYKVPIYNP